MLRREFATALGLLIAVGWLSGGCGSTRPVEQEIPGTDRVVLHIDGMT